MLSIRGLGGRSVLLLIFKLFILDTPMKMSSSVSKK